MSQDVQERWAQCLLNIERRLRPQTFNTWFRPTTARRFDDEVLEIEVSSSYFAHFVESNYLSMIRSVVDEETGLCPRIGFVVDEVTPARAETVKGPATRRRWAASTSDPGRGAHRHGHPETHAAQSGLRLRFLRRR